MIDKIDIGSYADDSTPSSAGKKNNVTETQNCKRHQSDFLNGSIKMA